MPRLSKKSHLFIPYNARIVQGVTQADVGTYFLDLGTLLGESRKIVAIHAGLFRTAGTGAMYLYPNEGGTGWLTQASSNSHWVVIKPGTQRLQYSLLVANDVFDVYCFGYVVEV